LKAGTRLVREWRGVTSPVLVHADGFEWNGQSATVWPISSVLIGRGATVGLRPVGVTDS
jgi:hypothetical protein